MVAKCWRARISVGAISADWPPASAARAMASSADHRLARADIALQQAQHALGLGEVGVDFGQRLLLRAGQRIGKRGADLRLDRAVAGQRPAGKPPGARAHQRQRDLTGQQFVIGEPPPGSAVDRDVDRVGGIVQPRQRLGERRKGLASASPPRPAIPAGRAGGASAWPMARRSTLADRPAVSG